VRRDGAVYAPLTTTLAACAINVATEENTDAPS
jgi:hypothetical protein